MSAYQKKIVQYAKANGGVVYGHIFRNDSMWALVRKGILTTESGAKFMGLRTFYLV